MSSNGRLNPLFAARIVVDNCRRGVAVIAITLDVNPTRAAGGDAVTRGPGSLGARGSAGFDILVGPDERRSFLHYAD